MDALDVFALVVLIVLLITAVAVWIVLAMLPGKIAASRHHPQTEAINVAGWLGALLGMVLWPLALIWAYTRSGSMGAPLSDQPKTTAQE